MSDSDEENVTWSELPNVGIGSLMETSILDIESKIHQSFDWQDQPIALATLHMSTLAGMGSISVQVMTDLPEAVLEQPMPGFRHMVDLMITDVAHEDPDMEWLDEVVSRPGFMGWIVILTGYIGDDSGNRVRNVMFHSRTQGIFATERIEGNEPRYSWAPEDLFCEDSELAQTVVRLNELSHFVRLRNWMRSFK